MRGQRCCMWSRESASDPFLRSCVCRDAVNPTSSHDALLYFLCRSIALLSVSLVPHMYLILSRSFSSLIEQVVIQCPNDWEVTGSSISSCPPNICGQVKRRRKQEWLTHFLGLWMTAWQTTVHLYSHLTMVMLHHHYSGLRNVLTQDSEDLSWPTSLSWSSSSLKFCIS